MSTHELAFFLDGPGTLSLFPNRSGIHADSEFPPSLQCAAAANYVR